MKVEFSKLEDYLEQFGYPRNEFGIVDFDIPAQTAYEYTMSNAAKHADTLALTYAGGSITYGLFAEQVDAVADGVVSLGVSCGERVGVLLPNIPQAAFIQYGPSKVGASVSNVDPRTGAVQLLGFVRRERLRLLVVLDVLYELSIKPIERELREECGIEFVVVVSSSSDGERSNRTNKSKWLEVVPWGDFIANARFQHAVDVGFSPNREAFVQHSSGTSSGLPKSISLTNENVNSFVEKHRPTEFGELSAGTRFLQVLPYFASYGAVNTSHLGLNLGFTLQQIPEFGFGDLGFLAGVLKSQIVIGIPSWFAAMTKDERIGASSLESVVMAIAGGEGCSAADKRTINSFLKAHGAQCEMTCGHGMSELSGSASYTFSGITSGAGIGKPFPYDKYVILDDQGNVASLDEEGARGSAWVYSPSAADGVFDDEPFARTVEICGFRFLETGDTISIRPDYEMEFLEREDRAFARYDGHKVVPADVERVICSHESASDCLVVPYEDDILGGKMPIAYIVLGEPFAANVGVQDVSAIVGALWAASELTERDLPSKISFVSALPLTLAGKIDYRALAARPLDGSEFTIRVVGDNSKVDAVEVVSPEKSLKTLVADAERLAEGARQ